MLSNFINRRKVKKVSLFDAALRRAASSPFLEVQSDQENPLPKQWTFSKPPPVASLRASALRRQSSPKVHLDFIPSGSNDWFPQEILAPYEDDSHLPIQPVPESSTSSVYGDVVVIGPERVSVDRSFPTSHLSQFHQSLPLLSRNPARPSPRCRPTASPPQSTQDSMYVAFCFTLSINTLTRVPYHHSRPPLHLYHANHHRHQSKFPPTRRRSKYNSLHPRRISASGKPIRCFQ